MAAGVVGGRKVADGLRALVVPGSVRGEAGGRGRGARPVFERRGVRLARRRLLDVPGHEPRQAGPRRALRQHQQPQLRGTPGQGRAHAPRDPRRRRRHRDRRPLRDPGGPRADGARSPSSRAPRCPSTAPTSTPTRSSRPTTSSASSAPGSDRSCSPSGARIPTSCSTIERYAGASILIAGANFGSGSSREHAPWAIEDYGFQAVIAPSFADIFRNNCTKIGLLPVELRAESVRALMDAVLDDPTTRSSSTSTRWPSARPASTRPSTSRTSRAGA